MATNTLDPQIAAAIARDLAKYGPRDRLRADNLAEIRADFMRRRLERGMSGGPAMRETREEEVALPGRRIRLRLHVPASAAPVGPALFYFHGGGWAWGSIDTHDRIMRELAQRSGCRVVGVDYRKAPEHPFPLPFDDCLEATRHVLGRAGEFGIDPARFALGGDSAGANLALAAGLVLAAEGRAPATLLLYYGTFDCDLGTSSYMADFGDGRFGLSRADMALFLGWYLGGDGTSADPRAVPLKGELSALRRAFLLGCGLDPLRDDNRRLAAALAAAGVRFDFRELPDACHGFLFMAEDVAASRAALATGAAHLAAAVAPRG
jgi:acetyl esterase